MNSLMMTMWLFVVVWTLLGYFCVRVGGKAPLGTTFVYTLASFVSAVVISGA